jgi:hypothetical protein
MIKVRSPRPNYGLAKTEKKESFPEGWNNGTHHPGICPARISRCPNPAYPGIRQYFRRSGFQPRPSPLSRQACPVLDTGMALLQKKFRNPTLRQTRRAYTPEMCQFVSWLILLRAKRMTKEVEQRSSIRIVHQQTLCGGEPPRANVRNVCAEYHPTSEELEGIVHQHTLCARRHRQPYIPPFGGGVGKRRLGHYLYASLLLRKE